ncbi:MAG: thiol reductant ABC exporter subunit CydC, partial [Gammaproteobacteria bacterium]
MIQLFKPFLKKMYHYRYWMISGFLLVIMTGIAGIALLALASWFLSAAAFAGLSVVTAMQFNYLLPGAGVRLFAFIRIVARYGERLLNHESVFRFISCLRLWLFTHLTRLSPQQLGLIKNSEMLNRFMSDINVLDNIFLRVITPFFSTIILILITTLFLCLLNISVAIVCVLVLLSLLLLLSLIMLMNGRQVSNNYQQALNQLRVVVLQTMSAWREIKLFNAASMQHTVFENNLADISSAQMKLSKKNGIAQAILIIGIGMLVIITLIISIHATQKGILNGANIAVIFIVLIAIGELLLPVITAFLAVGQTEQAIVNINELMAVKPLYVAPEYIPITPRDAKFDIKNEPYDIEIQNITFNYPDHGLAVFNQFSLTIPTAQHIALIGASGVGKSTLVNLLARFIRPQVGQITINHRDLYMLTDQQWQTLFAIVPQQPYLFDTTVRENLLIANLQATDELCWHALEICQIKSFIATLPAGLDTYLGQHGEHLSGGQAKRVALARAILKNAPITILDEPTEGLDSDTAQQVMANVLAHVDQHGQSLLLITHQRHG